MSIVRLSLSLSLSLSVYLSVSPSPSYFHLHPYMYTVLWSIWMQHWDQGSRMQSLCTLLSPGPGTIQCTACTIVTRHRRPEVNDSLMSMWCHNIMAQENWECCPRYASIHYIMTPFAYKKQLWHDYDTVLQHVAKYKYNHVTTLSLN